MLTPLGRGGTGRHRRWSRVLAVVLVLAGVGAVAVGAWWWFTQRDDTTAQPSPSPSRTCRTPTPDAPKKLPDASAVSVSVANGTERTGLALDTADALVARGFVVVDVGNTDKPVKRGVALVRYRKPDLASAVRVASYLPGATLKPVKVVEDGAVAVWLGPDFDTVASAADADVEGVRLPPGEPRCRTIS